LNKADPCVETLVQATGEHVIVASGEVHLERCLKDLRESFAQVALSVSEPIVAFKETLAPTDVTPTPVTTNTPSESCTIVVTALPLPPSVTKFLNAHCTELTRLLVDDAGDSDPDSVARRRRSSNLGTADGPDIMAELKKVLVAAGPEWAERWPHLWCLGPDYSGCNMLFNCVPGFEHKGDWLAGATGRVEQPGGGTATTDEIVKNESSLVGGFQFATRAGPLCEEPMEGVAFVVHKVELNSELANPEVYGPLSGQVMSTMTLACRRALSEGARRLVEPLFLCEIAASSAVLGSVYQVLAKRRGRIRSEELREGTDIFNIQSYLPVVESFGFADDLRKKTSGGAAPQLVLSHWETLNVDPFFTPTTEDEREEFGEVDYGPNIAREYMNKVRKRKGLRVEEKIVEHAEKQRNLSRKK